MLYLQVFVIGIIFSFFGSIPPGTLNIGVLQLGLQGKIATALRFALAVALIEYPYTWMAIEFENWITSSPMVTANFQLITAVVMTAVGILTLWAAQKPASFATRFNESGFRRGLLLSILNPMAIPFWILVTAWLKSQQWILLTTAGLKHAYILGTSVGAMLLLTGFTFLAARLSPLLQHNRLVKILPGIVLLMLGLYSFGKYFFTV